jgi:MFS transporter, DHA1 family, multidrug resistance protein
MSRSSVRTILPLAVITCTSMLAADLYLPAVPHLQRSLGIDVILAQATVAIFFAGLAVSQLLWAELLSHWGPRRSVVIGVSLLALASVGAALAPTINVLLAMRLLQGLAAGVSTVVAPSVIRATLHDSDAVHGIAAISMIESFVPAAGPVLGAALLLSLEWRDLFWILAGLSVIALPFIVRVTPIELPGLDRAVDASYGRIIANKKYLRLALSHALCVGGLLSFVASAPQLMINALGLTVSAFAALQVMGVATFMIMASQSGRISQKIGPARAIQLGAWVQVVLTGILLLAAWVVEVSFAGVAVFWCGFCGALAVRGPAAFSEALSLPPSQMGRASAMLVLALLLASALGTQLVAPFMDGKSIVPLAITVMVQVTVSLMLVIPYPVNTPR